MKRSRRTVLGRALLALCALVPALAGCTGSGQQVSVTGADLVLVTGVQDSDLDGAAVKGALLVRRGGSTRRVQTDGMDNAKLVRTARGVAFSDVHKDYLLGDSLTASARNEAGSLEVGAVLAADGRVVAAFNNGDDSLGYRTDVVRFDAAATALTRKYGVVPEGVAQCATDEYLVGIPNDDPEKRTTFQAIGAEKETTLTLPFSPGNWPDQVPCAGEQILSVMQDADHEGVAHVINVTASRATVSSHRLVATEGGPLKLIAGEADVIAIRPRVLVDGRLEWLGDASGQVYRTDPESGRTSIVASGLPSGEQERVVRFTDAGCDILTSDDHGAWRLLRYTADWKLAKEEDLPWLAGELGDRWVFDFLVLD